MSHDRREQARQNGIVRRRDLGHGMFRTELLCPPCGTHFGRVSEGGPSPTGRRHRINSVALRLQAEQTEPDD